MEEQKTLLRDEMVTFRDPEFREFNAASIEHFPPYFWENPASSTRKYHPPWANEYGGLVKHTIAVMRVADKLQTSYQLNDVERDAALTAALFHDAVKYGFHGGKYTSALHEAEGAMFFNRCAKKFAPDLPLQTEIYNAIATHQGPWTKATGKESFPSAFDNIGQVVHLADMVASMPSVNFTFFEEGSFLG